MKLTIEQVRGLKNGFTASLLIPATKRAEQMMLSTRDPVVRDAMLLHTQLLPILPELLRLAEIGAQQDTAQL